MTVSIGAASSPPAILLCCSPGPAQPACLTSATWLVPPSLTESNAAPATVPWGYVPCILFPLKLSLTQTGAKIR